MAFGRNLRPSEGIYRLILALFALDTVLGIGLLLVGELLIESREISIAGGGLALIGAGLFLFFLALGRRRQGAGGLRDE